MSFDTPEGWWAELDAAWPDILKTARYAHAPLSKLYESPDGLIVDLTLSEALEKAKRDRDHETIHLFLERVWGAAPDSPSIHSWPAWGEICDLCSEYSTCFYAQEGEP